MTRRIRMILSMILTVVMVCVSVPSFTEEAVVSEGNAAPEITEEPVETVQEEPEAAEKTEDSSETPQTTAVPDGEREEATPEVTDSGIPEITPAEEPASAPEEAPPETPAAEPAEETPAPAKPAADAAAAEAPAAEEAEDAEPGEEQEPGEEPVTEVPADETPDIAEGKTETTEAPAAEGCAAEDAADPEGEDEEPQITVTVKATLIEDNIMVLDAIVDDPEGRSFTYQWQVSEDGGLTYKDIEDATEAELRIELTDENIHDLWRVRVETI
ncbi:hypothetical protein [Aristaeella lactis]|uniref:Uncharacterized protein n=1 Tax=Aristaeella lactis TaxID=3046383 RepID=A0AC61PQY9_9FIRM|nr:hypothetical protein [Aristaeella lactis]QUA54152.1 hypothetical protein JYE50_05895 [Aristaeella lactis]SMC93865.1 hypothetical protein SAMN06297397_0112 [Aristaeella lactis]